jgi:hypothetical protein
MASVWQVRQPLYDRPLAQLQGKSRATAGRVIWTEVNAYQRDGKSPNRTAPAPAQQVKEKVMAESKTIAVVIPFYKNQDELTCCLTALERQISVKTEVFVRDNSDDNIF